MDMPCYIMNLTEIKIQEYVHEASLLNEQDEDYICHLEKLAIKKIHQIVMNLSAFNTFHYKHLIPTKKELVCLFLIRNKSYEVQKFLLDY